MQRLARRVWEFPWPPRLRRLAEPLVTLDALQFFLVPHFRCGVVGIIQNDLDEYLLLKHTYRNNFPWGLPTGFMEHGEQPGDALCREVQEEAGYTVVLQPVWNIYVDERSIINVVYRGRVRSGSFSSSGEISAAGFFPYSDLPPMQDDQRVLIDRSHQEADH